MARVWGYLELRCVSFADLGLDPADSDLKVWDCCQAQEVLLITDNRNQKAADSLETTIRAKSTPTSLPVFTIGDARRLLTDGEYADRIVDRLLRYLLELNAVRGTGRLYLP